MRENNQVWKNIRFNAQGLICAIAVDAKGGEILMQAWMNRQALEVTLREGRACYYSRSRQKLWRKGERSGNHQILKDIWVDCDGDCLLLHVIQTGAACHTGRKSCFFQRIDRKTHQLESVYPPIQDPEQLYPKK